MTSSGRLSPDHFWKRGVPSRTEGERMLEMLWKPQRGVPSRTEGERMLEMLWKPQVPWIIGFGGSQGHSRGEFQETLWERFGVFPEFFVNCFRKVLPTGLTQLNRPGSTLANFHKSLRFMELFPFLTWTRSVLTTLRLRPMWLEPDKFVVSEIGLCIMTMCKVLEWGRGGERHPQSWIKCSASPSLHCQVPSLIASVSAWKGWERRVHAAICLGTLSLSQQKSNLI